MERELSRLSHVTREDGEYASQVKTPEPHSEPVDTQEKVEQAEPVTPAWMPAYEALRQDWNSLIEDARQTGTPSFYAKGYMDMIPSIRELTENPDIPAKSRAPLIQVLENHQRYLSTRKHILDYPGEAQRQMDARASLQDVEVDQEFELTGVSAYPDWRQEAERLTAAGEAIQAVHGYPVFLAETFVDVSRFVGTCYRASNWRSLGLTRGFAREPGGSARWRHHGQPKEIFVFELTDAAAEALSRTEVPAHWNAEQHTEPMAAPRLRSLFECLGEVPECRRDRGKRYPLNTVLAIAVAARLAGYRGVNAFAQFAALLSQEQIEAVGAFWSPSKQRYTAPAITTFHNILAALPPETLDNAIGQWTGQHSTAHAPVAMDGKDLRGASKQTEDGRRMMVAAVEHDSGMVLGQVEVDSKSNEIPAVRELSSSLDLAGRIVTVDAMHAQHETARCLLGRRADYVISAIKDNQETILEDLKAIDFSDAPWHETVDKGHGRIERRRCAAVDLSGAEWDGYANLHGRRQAMRIEREREILKTGKSSIEVTWSLTSLGTDRAGPEELLALVRNHWHIENRLHYVRDFTYDEDRCRAYVRHLPRNLACLTNVAIAIVRCSGRFRYLPEANRHYAARAQDALDAILIAPTA